MALDEFTATALRLSVPVAYAALGGVVAERAGVYHVALEGAMLAGCFGAALGAFHGGAMMGLMVGMLAGVLVGALLAAMTVTLRLPQIVCGISVNLLVIGLTAYLSRIVFSGQANTLHLPGLVDPWLPALAGVPVLGPAFFAQPPLMTALPLLAAGIWWWLHRTHAGLALRAVGEAPRCADANGIDVQRTRWTAVVVASVCAALGGCFIVLSQVFLFSEHMTAGKGFIALAAVILGRWSVWGALLAAVFFGGFDALQLKLQFSQPDLPYQLFVALPYVAALLALFGLMGRSSPPHAVGQPYQRSTR
ncbi:MAG: ABC transporter permease [Pseudomonadota bacterium]|uniref:ABC transporter permease n=1 Tax=Aquabacterium sp. TaxID=1872578 RepID=UPI003BB04335